MKKIKIRWIIEISIIILFIFTNVYSYIKSDDYDSKARNYKSYSEEGFLLEIIQEGYYAEKACIRITVKYNKEMTYYWKTDVATNNKLIRDENFNVEFCGDYVKINVIDKNGKIVGVFRAYKKLEDISSQSDAEGN